MKLIFGIFFKKGVDVMLIFYECNKNQTRLLLAFLLSKCDFFTFCLPNYGTIFRMSDPSNVFKEYELVKDNLERDNVDFLVYKQKVSSIINRFSDDTIKTFCSIQYYDYLCNYEKEIYLVRYNDKTFKILENENVFNDWIYPNFPEDLCFLKNNECYFSSVSHDKEYYIYDDSVQATDFLNEIGIQYTKTEFIEPPKLRTNQTNY